MTLRIVARTSDVVAEGPVWHADTERLYWVDIERGLLHCVEASGANVETIRFPERIGSFAFREGGGLVVALERSIALCDGEGNALRRVFANPEPRGATRFNDGKCDPAGRFWAGTLDLAFRQPLGSLYCLDRDLSVRRVIPDVCISNGLAWSPDGSKMYFADSVTRRVDRYAFDAELGILGNGTPFVDTSPYPGMPDGGTVSDDGRYWLAMYDGGCVLVVGPEGDVRNRIDLPVPRPTCCAFGGRDGRTLFITCAADDPGVRAPAFEGASVLALDVDARGVPAAAFRGSAMPDSSGDGRPRVPLRRQREPCEGDQDR
ncbi:MAG: SMP-30/gluconolactonase/LRE family protein [Betaproteobacteria bacterium]